MDYELIKILIYITILWFVNTGFSCTNNYIFNFLIFYLPLTLIKKKKNDTKETVKLHQRFII